MGTIEENNKYNQKINPPEKLTTKHDVADFFCGEATLDDWLKNKALKNETGDASRTYVVCVDEKVIGYYALAVGSVAREVVTKQIQRNTPDTLPVMILARLAVDHNWNGLGIGRGLLRDAILRTLQASNLAGIKAIIVHAISQEAKTFYEKAGFKPSPLEPLTLMISLKEARISMSSGNII